MAQSIGTFLSGFFLITVYSYLFKESRLYRYTEHIYVGFAAAHAIVTGWYNVKDQALSPLADGQWLMLVPLCFGCLLYAKFTKRYSYLSRTPLAFMMGVAAGVTITGAAEASFVKQIRATILPLNNLDNIVMVLGTVSTLAFFLFIPLGSKKAANGKRSFMSLVSNLGRATMMVAFGSSFGFVVMARLSYLIARLQFLFSKVFPVISQ